MHPFRWAGSFSGMRRWITGRQDPAGLQTLSAIISLFPLLYIKFIKLINPGNLGNLAACGFFYLSLNFFISSLSSCHLCFLSETVCLMNLIQIVCFSFTSFKIFIFFKIFISFYVSFIIFIFFIIFSCLKSFCMIMIFFFGLTFLFQLLLVLFYLCQLLVMNVADFFNNLVWKLLYCTFYRQVMYYGQP